MFACSAISSNVHPPYLWSLRVAPWLVQLHFLRRRLVWTTRFVLPPRFALELATKECGRCSVPVVPTACALALSQVVLRSLRHYRSEVTPFPIIVSTVGIHLVSSTARGSCVPSHAWDAGSSLNIALEENVSLAFRTSCHIEIPCLVALIMSDPLTMCCLVTGLHPLTMPLDVVLSTGRSPTVAARDVVATCAWILMNIAAALVLTEGLLAWIHMIVAPCPLTMATVLCVLLALLMLRCSLSQQKSKWKIGVKQFMHWTLLRFLDWGSL